MHHLARGAACGFERRTQDAMTRHAVFDHTRYEIFRDMDDVCPALDVLVDAVRIDGPWRGPRSSISQSTSMEGTVQAASA